MKRRSAFTLIELLITIAVISILAVVVIVTLNPAELLRQSRDSSRLSDMDTLTHALSLYNTDQSASVGFSLGSASTTYVSIPDPSATSTAGDQCQGLSLPSLGTGLSYHCSSLTAFRNADGTGWVPVNFGSISSGIPFGNLPVDPTNNSSSHLYYTYTTNGVQYELTVAVEAAKDKLGAANDLVSTDGGTKMSLYEKGTSFTLEPLDYGDASLVGYWALDEGSGSSALDGSGNGIAGTWNGTPSGAGGTFYTIPKVGKYSGYFDGSSNYINVGDPATFPGGFAARTMCGWGQLRSIPGTWGWMFSIGAGTGDNAMFIGAGSGGMLDGGGYGDDLSVGAFWSTNTWTFVCLSYDGTTGYLYANGTLMTSAAKSWNLSRSLGYIGRQVNNLEPWPGLVDDVRLYNRVLSANEIKAIYTAGK